MSSQSQSLVSSIVVYTLMLIHNIMVDLVHKAGCALGWGKLVIELLPNTEVPQQAKFDFYDNSYNPRSWR